MVWFVEKSKVLSVPSLDKPLPGPAARAALAYYLCVRAATYEILKDHPVPVDVSNPRVDVSNLRIGDTDSLRGVITVKSFRFISYQALNF